MSLGHPRQQAAASTGAPLPPAGSGFLCPTSKRQRRLKTNFDLSGLSSIIYNVLKKVPALLIAEQGHLIPLTWTPLPRPSWRILAQAGGGKGLLGGPPCGVLPPVAERWGWVAWLVRMSMEVPPPQSSVQTGSAVPAFLVCM